MRRALPWLAPALLLAGLLPTEALAQDSTEEDGAHNTEEPKQAEQPAPVLTPAAPVVPAVAPPVAAPPKPKFGDVTTSGYLRGGFGASSQKGRMTCFSLSNPAGLVSKYRLGNECEVWGEYHLTTVVYAGEDGTVASLHFMPTVYIPTTHIGYSPNGAVNSPAESSTSTGAVLYFPNLYADIKGVPWLFGGTAWMGTRYYKRESVYISDFFYWNPSGVGAGVEDIDLGNDLRLSYAVFAVDGEPVPPTESTSPPLTSPLDFGFRNDLQLRGIHLWPGGELQLGFQYIANFSNNPATHSGWGVTGQLVQKLLGGDNKLAVQYGRGGGTGFGTLARFYYPDFSVKHVPSEARLRVVDVLTVQPLPSLGAQLAGVYQRDMNFLGSAGFTTVWWSAGGRVGYAVLKHLKLLGEAGYDQITKSNGAKLQYLYKATGAVALTTDPGFWSRPELRLFATYARWNDPARIAGVDSGNIYRDIYTDFLSGWIFGLQAETWW
jgi:maltoporin